VKNTERRKDVRFKVCWERKLVYYISLILVILLIVWLQLIKFYVFLQLFLDIVVARTYLEEENECNLQATTGAIKDGRTFELETVTTNAWKAFKLEIVNIRKLFLMLVLCNLGYVELPVL
jgi:hypothetical protein